MCSLRLTRGPTSPRAGPLRLRLEEPGGVGWGPGVETLPPSPPSLLGLCFVNVWSHQSRLSRHVPRHPETPSHPVTFPDPHPFTKSPPVFLDPHWKVTPTDPVYGPTTPPYRTSNPSSTRTSPTPANPKRLGFPKPGLGLPSHLGGILTFVPSLS